MKKHAVEEVTIVRLQLPGLRTLPHSYSYGGSGGAFVYLFVWNGGASKT